MVFVERPSVGYYLGIKTRIAKEWEAILERGHLARNNGQDKNLNAFIP